MEKIIHNGQEGYFYPFFRPGITCDTILWRRNDDFKIETLISKRNNEPYKNYWCIPGGFLEKDETLKQCAIRELKEETTIEIKHSTIEPEQLLNFLTYYDLISDPRGQSVNMFFTCYYDENPKPTQESSEFKWVSKRIMSDIQNVAHNIIPHHYDAIMKFFDLMGDTY